MTTSSGAMHREARRATLAVLLFGSAAILCGGGRGDPEFMQYDAEKRLVQLIVVAAYDRSNSGFNLNGGSGGSHRITVPVGWRVEITFSNRDVIPHSVGVVRDETRLPLRFGKPAFAGAASYAMERGIPAGTRDYIHFVADRPGAYLLACGVPGHAATGSYLRFIVSPDATVPTYATGPALARSTSRH
jgi:sulfocyanin